MRILIFADISWRMLTYADVCDGNEIGRFLGVGRRELRDRRRLLFTAQFATANSGWQNPRPAQVEACLWQLMPQKYWWQSLRGCHVHVSQNDCFHHSSKKSSGLTPYSNSQTLLLFRLLPPEFTLIPNLERLGYGRHFWSCQTTHLYKDSRLVLWMWGLASFRRERWW